MVAVISALLAVLVGATAPAAAASPAPAAVEVHFIAPERYRDAQPTSGEPRQESEREREAVLEELRAHLQQLGQRHLQAGDRLTIEILELDLAGEGEFLRGGVRERRVLRADTWPAMRLHSVLERGDQRFETTERIADPSYQLRTSECRTGEFLCHEKRMLSDWFDRRFGRGK